MRAKDSTRVDTDTNTGCVVSSEGSQGRGKGGGGCVSPVYPLTLPITPLPWCTVILTGVVLGLILGYSVTLHTQRYVTCNNF